jgi:hypothetical protein
MNTRLHDRGSRLALSLVALVMLTACAGMPRPNEVVAPAPIPSNTGKFLSPYTSDGTVAPWVVKGRAAKLGGAIGGFAGRKVGEAAIGTVPFVGGWLGRKAGDKAGREIALKMVGGEQALRETSDLSFDAVDDLIVFLYASHWDEKNKDWNEAFDLTKAIYPDLEKRWNDAIKKAPRKAN